MASTTPTARTITISECAACGVDKEVHQIDGCTFPTYQRVKVCRGCHERHDECSC